MQLDSYYSPSEAGSFSFSRDNASRFAKQVADDFNPIHDIDASRFCVPGDLLFAVALSKLGLSKSMHIRFADMVDAGVRLSLQTDPDGVIAIRDGNAKTYLTITAQGDHCDDRQIIQTLTEQYVAFSGTTFPHVLVPLWEQQGVMVNPARPLVIYQSMSIELNSFDFSSPQLRLTNPSLEVSGKRGNVRLPFIFLDGEREIGHGEKRMVISGLKPYDPEAIAKLVEFYNQRKQSLKH